jgi:thioredoxin-related protein
MFQPAASPEPARNLSFDRPQLVVFESQSCSWCHRFRKSVAPVYEMSHLDRRAPLRYADISEQRSGGYRLESRITATPTFVLVDRQGREVARMRGIPGGKDAFLPEVEKMLGKLPEGESG